MGLAVGDALGTTVEFQPPGTFEPVTDMVGGGPFGLSPGQWTDDTSMALCLAESLLARGGMDVADQARRYVRWWREGHLSSTGRCFDIGIQTREALERFEGTGDPLSGPDDPRRSGNGSIMRLAPVAMFFALSPREALEACAESSRTTHGSRLCVDACRYLGALMLEGFERAGVGDRGSRGRTRAYGGGRGQGVGGGKGAEGGDRDQGLGADPVPGYWDEHPLTPQVREVAEGSFMRREPPEIAGTGFVVRSLEAALWAFHRSTSFREGALLAVNLGDDADTTGAVYGQIAGAHYGEEAIPVEWRAKLALWPTIDFLAERLFERATTGA